MMKRKREELFLFRLGERRHFVSYARQQALDFGEISTGVGQRQQRQRMDAEN